MNDLSIYTGPFEVVLHKEGALALMALIILLAVLELIMVMKIRNNLKPAFQIMSP
jgi:hypothetical protein